MLDSLRNALPLLADLDLDVIHAVAALALASTAGSLGAGMAIGWIWARR